MRKFRFNLLILNVIFLLFSFLSNASADDRDLKMLAKNPEGTEFWLCFMKNHDDPEVVTEATRLHLELFITSDKDAVVTIEIPNLGFKETYKITKGTVRNVIIPASAQIKSSEVIEQRAAVHITSDNPISVYGLNRRKQTTDTFMGLPTNVLGTQYRVMCYNVSTQLSQFAVLATEDNTQIQITPLVNTMAGQRANMPFTIVLNKGDVYQVRGKLEILNNRKCDLTGSLVTADKKIAVFSGHQCAYVPDNVFACNHLIEQVPPILSWGKHYYIGTLKKRTKYTFRVLANLDTTKVFEDGKLLRILRAGDFIERQTDRSVQIAADKPVLVSQYSQGFRNGDSIGDPMMLLISPTQQFLKRYRFATPVNGSWEHFVNIVSPKEAISSIKIDQMPIDSSKFVQISNTRYYLAQIKVNYGTHELTGNEPFGMSSYGFGYGNDEYDSYGNIGGQSFIDYVPIPDTLAPTSENRKIKKDFEIVFRDDRPDDTGLKSISVIESSGLNFNIPKFDESAPQANLLISSNGDIKGGTAIIEAKDMRDNISYWALCYSYDQFANDFVFKLKKGRTVECGKEDGIIYSAFTHISRNVHTPDFVESANIKNLVGRQKSNPFSSGTGTSVGFGLGVSKRLFANIIGTIKLDAIQYNGEIISVLSTPTRNNIGQIVDLIENRSAELNGLNLSLGGFAEYYFKSYIYALGGISFSYSMSNSITLKNYVVSPPQYSTSPNGKENIETINEYTALSSFGINFHLGIGATIPVQDNLSIFGELALAPRLNSLSSDAAWGLTRYYSNLGIKIKL